MRNNFEADHRAEAAKSRLEYVRDLIAKAGNLVTEVGAGKGPVAVSVLEAALRKAESNPEDAEVIRELEKEIKEVTTILNTEN